MFGKGKQLIGLDIGTSAVKMVVLKEQMKGFSLQALGYEPLPPEVIVDGAIMDSAIVVDAIQKIVKDQKIRRKNVALSVSGHSVIVKKITLPKMSQEELDESIHWEAEQYIPFDIDDVNIDFHILEEQNIGGNEMEVILVAVKKDKVNDYTNLVRQAGLTPLVVDVDGFAIGNQFELNYGLDSDRVIALIDIGAGVMNINIVQGRQHMLYRDISIGGNQFTDAIQKELNVSYHQAESIKRGEDVEGVSRDVADDIINSVAEDLSHEIQRSFDYFKATSSTSGIDQVVLTGGCSKTRRGDIAGFLSERLGVEVIVGNPLRNVSFNQKKFDPVMIEEIAPMCAVAVGLALRRG
ncbi:type IV pilus assembly protein PilM [bacterium]|nr:type IV pilus assembly protein PilM [candidate division CSSED10-310 bacterium]